MRLLTAIRSTPASHLARATECEPTPAFEFVVAGYSRARDVFEVHVFCGHDKWAGLGFPPFVLKRTKQNVFLPAPNPAVANEMGWTIPPLDDGFDVERDGLKLMECQRRDRASGCHVGGFVQVVLITRAGVASRIAKWWPDEIGRKIEPESDRANDRPPVQTPLPGEAQGLYANLAEAIPHMKPDDEELTKALAMTVKATGRLMEDEVGMQGLASLMMAIEEPERLGTRYVSNLAASFLPYSSFLRQTASALDPEMREVKNVVDGLRYYIPVARQGLVPKRDWLGESILNAGYGGDLPVPGVSAVIQHREATPDLLGVEMKLLDLHPAPPVNRIGGVQLPPHLYEEYQVKAGSLTRPMLEHFIDQPGWDEMPRFVREELFRKAITQARASAAALMQAEHPELIQVGVENKMRRIRGEKVEKRLPDSSEVSPTRRGAGYVNLREEMGGSPAFWGPAAEALGVRLKGRPAEAVEADMARQAREASEIEDSVRGDK